MAVKLYPPVAEDVSEIGCNLRTADRIELERTTGSADFTAIAAECVARSPESYIAVDPAGKAVALFGCAPLGALVSGYGAPWLLGTPRLERQARALMFLSRNYISKWRGIYPALVNFVDAENELSIKYLSALGFTLDAPVPHGAQGTPFRRFWMEGIV